MITIWILITFPLVFDLIFLGLNCCWSIWGLKGVNEVKVKLQQFFAHTCDSTKIYRFSLVRVADYFVVGPQADKSSAEVRLILGVRTCYTHEWRKTKKSIEPRKTRLETKKKFSGSYTEVNPEVSGHECRRGHYKDYKDLTLWHPGIINSHALDIIDFSNIARGVSQTSVFHDLVTECTTVVFKASPIRDWGMNFVLSMTIVTPFSRIFLMGSLPLSASVATPKSRI